MNFFFVNGRQCFEMYRVVSGDIIEIPFGFLISLNNVVVKNKMDKYIKSKYKRIYYFFNSNFNQQYKEVRRKKLYLNFYRRRKV